MNSPGKRKFGDMNSQNYSNSVRELIGNFEVGTPTKRQKTGRSSCYVDDQLHSSLEFGTGKTKIKKIILAFLTSIWNLWLHVLEFC